MSEITRTQARNVSVGAALGSAALLLFVAFGIFEAGQMRYLVLGVALVEMIVTPLFLYRALAPDE